MSDDEIEKRSDNDETPAAAADQQPQDAGILANEHDVDKLGEEIAKLLQGLAKRGLAVNVNMLDLNNLKARIEARANSRCRRASSWRSCATDQSTRRIACVGDSPTTVVAVIVQLTTIS